MIAFDFSILIVALRNEKGSYSFEKQLETKVFNCSTAK